MGLAELSALLKGLSLLRLRSDAPGLRACAQDLSENMGLAKLNGRLQDPLCAAWFEGLFPRDSPRNMRFSINFFTSIGLGGLTDALRSHLKARPPATLLCPFPSGVWVAWQAPLPAHPDGRVLMTNALSVCMSGGGLLGVPVDCYRV